MTRAERVAIVGGGASGVLVAAQLLLRARRPVEVLLIERTGRPGRGVAYSTPWPGHLLNVPAGNMSALPEAPDDLVKWLEARSPKAARPLDAAFVPRPVYALYLGDVLAAAERGAPAGVRLVRVAGEVLAADPDGTLHFACGEPLAAQHVVLALGNFPPSDAVLPTREFSTSSRFVPDPWNAARVARLPLDGPVLVLGAGLTMADMALLLAERGLAHPIHCLSRRGLLPRAHRAHAPIEPFTPPPEAARSARGLLADVRGRIRATTAAGGDWRAVIDALRPATQSLWRDLPPAERRRFLRHLRVHWDVARHRVAPEIGAQLDQLRAEGRLVAHAGRVLALRDTGGAATVDILERGTGRRTTLEVSAVVNCTGLTCDIRQYGSPMIQSLFAQRLARADALGAGFATDARGALLDADGTPSPVFSTLGPLRRGDLWESIAIPEIRVQAAELAARILA